MYSSVLLAICIRVYGMFRLSKSLRRWEVNSNSQRALTRPGGHRSCEMGWVGEEAYEEARVLSFLLCLVVTIVSVVHPNSDTLGIHVWLYSSTFGLLLSYFLMVDVGKYINPMACIAAAGGLKACDSVLWTTWWRCCGTWTRAWLWKDPAAWRILTPQYTIQVDIVVYIYIYTHTRILPVKFGMLLWLNWVLVFRPCVRTTAPLFWKLCCHGLQVCRKWQSQQGGQCGPGTHQQGTVKRVRAG